MDEKILYPDIIQSIVGANWVMIHLWRRLQKQYPESYDVSYPDPLTDDHVLGIAADNDAYDVGWDMWEGDPERPGVAAPGNRRGDQHDPGGWLAYAEYCAKREFLSVIREMRKRGYGVAKVDGEWRTYHLGPEESQFHCGPEHHVIFTDGPEPDGLDVSYSE